MPQSAYAPNCLVPSSTRSSDGVGPLIELGPLRGKLLLVTLGINNVVEQEALAISIWGSASETGWGIKPLLSFPKKSYCGVYTAFLNLANYPAVRFLRVEWKMSRLRNRNCGLMFGFSVSLEESHSSVNAAVT
jgi:hypothetical protein